jgi:hypothetical protein
VDFTRRSGSVSNPSLFQSQERAEPSRGDKKKEHAAATIKVSGSFASVRFMSGGHNNSFRALQ